MKRIFLLLIIPFICSCAGFDKVPHSYYSASREIWKGENATVIFIEKYESKPDTLKYYPVSLIIRDLNEYLVYTDQPEPIILNKFAFELVNIKIDK
jgi:hypothetical protein